MNYEKKISDTLSGLFDAVCLKSAKTDSRLQYLETKSGHQSNVPTATLGERIAQSKQCQDFLKKGADCGRFNLTQNEIKAAILSTGSQNDPLTNTMRPPIAEGARRKLFLRDLLMAGTTTEAAVEYPIEDVFTNSAGEQVGGSPEAFENVSFGESGLTFTLSHQPVITIGHYINVSKNVLQDSGVLDAFLQTRLLYGLRLKEENLILNGTGSNGQLNGLLANAVAYTVQSPQLTNEIDIIREMIKQLELTDFSTSGIVLNPQDWYDIEVRKTGASTDEYAAGAPRAMGIPVLWGYPVITSTAIASGTALVSDFASAASLFDRQEAFFEYSYHNSTNFQKGLVTLKVTERVSLVPTNSLAMVTGAV